LVVPTVSVPYLYDIVWVYVRLWATDILHKHQLSSSIRDIIFSTSVRILSITAKS
jgi:hypothetical protein